MKMIDEAIACGARKAAACALVGVSIRSLQRWRFSPEDKRQSSQRPAPAHRLTQAEKQQILSVINQAEYQSLPPSQIVPRLADKGVYLACESTFYRVLREAGQGHRRGRSAKPIKRALPSTHIADGPDQVWSWDITYLPSRVKGQYFYLYLFEDIYSRRAVAYEVHEQESGEHAAKLIERAVRVHQAQGKLRVLHSDNGAPMKSFTMLCKLYDLGIAPSRSRPRVSNDNPYAESLFRTLKYCPQWPSQGFKGLEEARDWVRKFVHWYNEEHRHSGIRFVTPGQRHRRQDEGILANRHNVYQQARLKNPRRWSGKTRNWAPIAEVYLNPEREMKMAS
jgi:putative transposase